MRSCAAAVLRAASSSASIPGTSCRKLLSRTDKICAYPDWRDGMLEKGKATKTVERSHPDDFFYTTIMDRILLAEQNTGLFFPFPLESGTQGQVLPVVEVGGLAVDV